MRLHLSRPNGRKIKASLEITGSKSESNRLLLLQALYPGITIENLSNADDVQVMKKGLKIKAGTVDIHHAGTAMRFLTAYFATRPGKDVLLTGSSRMQERPISVLVEALISLGADIHYTKKEGYPPLKIKGQAIEKEKVKLPANISSQYISALLLVASAMPKGLELELVGKITSVPYIKMTLSLLKELGITCKFQGQTIRVAPQKQLVEGNVVVESDWSSASYYYSIIALSKPGSEVKLSSYKASSLQGDSVLQQIYRDFGVDTRFEGNEMILKKLVLPKKEHFEYDLSKSPDLAQTIAVTCFGLGMGCVLTGLHTLKIKETDRLLAMETELTKLGAQVSVSEEALLLEPNGLIKKDVAIDTYNDHRMAMAFAPLALCTPLTINDAMVVTKSYPDFWNDLSKLQFRHKEI